VKPVAYWRLLGVACRIPTEFIQNPSHQKTAEGLSPESGGVPQAVPWEVETRRELDPL